MDNNQTLEGWISVFKTNTDYEADLVRDQLDAEGIPAVVFTQRDHSFNFTVGDMADVHVMVPPERAMDAAQFISIAPVSDTDLETQAMEADPNAPAAHSSHEEAALDSGIEEIRLTGFSDDERTDENLA